MSSVIGSKIERRRIIIQGIVQGVGFRPFVYGQALHRNLVGFVLNDSAGVTIEVEGSPDALDGFQRALREKAPPLARIDSLIIEPVEPCYETAFIIAHSQAGSERHALISPDTATCDDCLRELFDPADRRYHYPFINCTNCGPRFTIIKDVPYDRDKTTMRVFPMCPACQAEYEDPLNRPFHAEANPFALMAPDPGTARRLCQVSDAGAVLLQSHRRPIVLLPQRPDCPVAPAVAPAYNTLGIMLPYTPLHHVLLHAFAEQIQPGQPAVLVMTSGNLSDEPIAYQDDDARQRLASIAEGILAHNRDIHMRCDDTVIRITAGGEQIMRRSRSYVPEPLSLPFDLPAPLLACGGHLKNTFGLAKGQQAFVSHHIGDLENLETLTSFREGIEHFKRLFDIYPQAIAYDLHPEYLATKYALDTGIPQKIGVQHHHAHIASVLAEHRLSGPVIGLAADGTGYGTDGAVWGCEIMSAHLLGFERLAHLAYVPLPGGDHAVRQPWRMAAVYLAQAYGDAFLDLDIPFVSQLDRLKWHVLAQMIARGINSLPTSSLGRLFDAVAALIGLRNEVLYEGQAAIELEILAQQQEKGIHEGQSIIYPFTISTRDQMPTTLDVAPMFRAIVSDIQQGVPASEIADRFHHSIAELLATVCFGTREQTGLNIIALSGGVFQNRLLLEQLVKRLEGMSFQIYVNRRVPPNDGGISLGQIVVAAAQLQRGKENGHASWFFPPASIPRG